MFEKEAFESEIMGTYKSQIVVPFGQMERPIPTSGLTKSDLSYEVANSSRISMHSFSSDK